MHLLSNANLFSRVQEESKNSNFERNTVMKIIIISTIYLLVSFNLTAQESSDGRENFLTEKYAGYYSYGKGTEESGFGSIIIYPETDSAILLYLNINMGGPSYNSGSLFIRLEIQNESAIYYNKIDTLEHGCGLTFHFLSDKLSVEQDDFECGFGHAVSPAGTYQRDSGDYKDHFFTGGEERKVYFNKKEDLLFLDRNDHIKDLID